MEQKRAWLRARSEARKDIREIREYVVESDNLEAVAPGSLERRRGLLEMAYQEFQKATKQLTTGRSVERRVKIDADTAKVKRWYITTGDRLDEAIRSSARELFEQPAAHSTQMPTISETIRPEVIRVETQRVPELLEFDGNPLNWPAFRDRFAAEVHDRDHIEPVMKLMYLQKMCVGEARGILGQWQTRAENYEPAWKLLQEKFDDPYQLEQALVSRMLTMRAAREETRPALRALIDTVTDTTRQLQAIGVDVQSWDPMVIGMLIRLLPARVKDVWEQRRDVLRPPSLRDLLSFLEARARGKLYTDGGRPVVPEMAQGEQADSGRFQRSFNRGGPSFHRNGPPFNHAGSNSNRNGSSFNRGGPPRGPDRPYITKCNMCKGNHPLFRCPTMLNASIDDRWRMVKNLRLCTACLKQHEGQCNRTCFRCNGRHDRVLCSAPNNVINPGLNPKQEVKSEVGGSRGPQ